MDGARDQLLTCSRFPGDQNSGVRRRHLCHASQNALQSGRLPHDLLEHRRLIDFFPQCDVLFVKLVLQLLDFPESALKIAFGLLTIGDVGRNAVNAARAAGLVQRENTPIVNPTRSAIGPQDAILNVVKTTTLARHPPRKVAADAFPILGINGLLPKMGISI